MDSYFYPGAPLLGLATFIYRSKFWYIYTRICSCKMIGGVSQHLNSSTILNKSVNTSCSGLRRQKRFYYAFQRETHMCHALVK